MLQRLVCGTTIAVLTFGLAGCGSDSDDTSPTTTAQEAVCADKDALEQSLRNLTDLDLATADESTIETEAERIQDDLNALGDSVKESLRPQVDGLKSAVRDVEDAIKSFGDQSIAQSIQDTGDAISKVGSAGADLATALNTECKS